MLAIYFKNLCDDYSNDLVDAMTVVNAYESNIKYFEDILPEQQEFKEQFESCFGMSGAASCENIEKIFAPKIAANPNDKDVFAQAFTLMKRAKCTSDFFFTVGEKYHVLNPSADVAMALAESYQDIKKYDKANQYLREALAKATDAVERENLLVRVGTLEMAENDNRAAVATFNEVLKNEAEDGDGLAYYFLAQCYVAGAQGCSGFGRDATFWVAYDMLQKAIPMLETQQPDLVENAKTLAASYRRAFPSTEECFFNELKEGSSYTVNCGYASGMTTRVRCRQ